MSRFLGTAIQNHDSWKDHFPDSEMQEIREAAHRLHKKNMDALPPGIVITHDICSCGYHTGSHSSMLCTKLRGLAGVLCAVNKKDDSAYKVEELFADILDEARMIIKEVADGV